MENRGGQHSEGQKFGAHTETMREHGKRGDPKVEPQERRYPKDSADCTFIKTEVTDDPQKDGYTGTRQKGSAVAVQGIPEAEIPKQTPAAVTRKREENKKDNKFDDSASGASRSEESSDSSCSDSSNNQYRPKRLFQAVKAPASLGSSISIIRPAVKTSSLEKLGFRPKVMTSPSNPSNGLAHLRQRPGRLGTLSSSTGMSSSPR